MDSTDVDFKRGARSLPRMAMSVAAAFSIGIIGLAAVSTVGGSSVRARLVAQSKRAPKINAKATFGAHGAIEQAYVLGAKHGETMILVNKKGLEIKHGKADRLGSYTFRTVPAGLDYRVISVKGAKVYGSPKFTIQTTHTTPKASFYRGQHLKVGLNYLKMRTGVTLAATLRLPSGAKSLKTGPFPTVMEYTGYADGPGTLLGSIISGKKTPLAPTSSTAVGSLIAPLVGFASVAVQMRGSGCSGGTFDLFGLNTTYDGYDAVQTIGSQPWVLDHKIGLVGISFSGISQMFIGGAAPPDLGAITPLSTTNNLYTTGFPGGLFNSGFAGTWLKAREAEAEPTTTPKGGADLYAKTLVKRGTKNCRANQKLHLQTQNLTTLLQRASHETPKLYTQRSPDTWASHVKVPVYMAGAFEDEETGPQWPQIIPKLKNDPDVFVNLQNGTHVTSLAPDMITRWLEFLDVFIAHKLPSIPAFVQDESTLLYTEIADAPSEPLPAMRFTHTKTAADAKANFIKDTPRVRVLFTNGGGKLGPGALQPVWTASFTSWPPPKAVATSFDLGSDGHLLSGSSEASKLTGGSDAKQSVSTVSFKPTPTARPATDLPSGNVWSALPPYKWTPVTGTEGVGFVTAPLKETMVAVGPGSLNLMVKTNAANHDTDLEATVTEIYPTGKKEMYVEGGLLRASDRALTAKLSTVLEPVPTYLHATPMPTGKFTLVRIPINPMGFAFRKGSRIRIVISAPGGDKPAWSFDTTYKTGGAVTDSIELGGSSGSSLVLPVVTTLKAPDKQPACPSLRGEPCRTYVPAGNGG